MRAVIALIIGFLLLTAANCRADLSWKSFADAQGASGYLTERGRYLLNTNVSDDLSFNAEYELDANLGHGLPLPLIGRTSPYLLGLDNVIASGPDSLLKQRVDRLNLKWHDWTIGRQAVSFGVGRIWEPNDLFAPFAPTEIDREYKTGIDLVEYDHELSELSDLTLIYAPTSGAPSSFAGRWRGTWSGFETSLIAAELGGQKQYGLCFDGSAGGAGVRGSLNAARQADDTTIYKYILGGDYLLSGNLYLIGEFYFNGAGSADPAGYDRAGLAAGNIFSLAQHYLAAGYSLDFLSLYNTTGYIISNFDDGSRLYWEEIRYSISDQSSLRSGVIFSSGVPGSEYGGLAAQGYVLFSLDL